MERLALLTVVQIGTEGILLRGGGKKGEKETGMGGPESRNTGWKGRTDGSQEGS